MRSTVGPEEVTHNTHPLERLQELFGRSEFNRVLGRGGIGVGTAETGLLELEAVGLRTSCMLVNLAG
ncbi:unnamed protein product [Rodentolepis nana]|uniref:Thiamine biosynthesis protein ThiF n=1 Tax=Rodentolepis nana TaxID=102285 RepID=A0A0R3TB99_RODNA|nr:unnamed protein product [Rodentolepis nana]